MYNYMNSHITLLLFHKFKEAGVNIEAIKPSSEEHADSI